MTCRRGEREHLIETDVVAGGGEQRGIRRERDRRIGTAVPHVANDVLRRHVLRIRRAAAIPAEEQRAPALHRLLHHAVRELEVGTHLRRDSLRGSGEIAKGFGER